MHPAPLTLAALLVLTAVAGILFAAFPSLPDRVKRWFGR